MQQLGLHQKKLFALIEALLAFIALLLPWTKYKVQAGMDMLGGGGGGETVPSDNGFRSWGWLVIIGVVAVIICSLLNDKMKDYELKIKYAVMGAFGLIALGAIIYLIALNNVGPLQTQNGTPVKAGAGMGLWLALVAGIIGLAWVSGILNQLTAGVKTTSSSPPSINPAVPPMPGAIPTPPGSMPPPPPPPLSDPGK